MLSWDWPITTWSWVCFIGGIYLLPMQRISALHVENQSDMLSCYDCAELRRSRGKPVVDEARNELRA